MIKLEEKNDEFQINMTPMIDMVFLLLIFFLTATTFTQKERELDVELPSSRVASSLSKALEQNVIINVKKEGEIVVAGRVVGEDQLRSFIKQRREACAPAPLKVKLRADRRTAHGHVAGVLDVVLGAGVSKAYIDTKILDLGS